MASQFVKGQVWRVESSSSRDSTPRVLGGSLAGTCAGEILVNSEIHNVQHFTAHAEVPPSVLIEETLSQVCDEENTGQV